MTKTLITGWRANNVAERFSQVLNDNSKERDIHLASKAYMDVTDAHEVHEVIWKYGPYDEIVYCSAVNELKWLKDIYKRHLEEAFAVNYFGWVNLIATHERMFPQRLKRAVALVSDAATTPMRGSLLYNSSKAALAFSIRNMARELAPNTVVVGVSPTVIDDTPMTDYIDEEVPKFRGWTPQHAHFYEKASIPMGRRVTKDEVAATMLFALTGPESLTGSIIDITGGK
jgi:NAD(P)-dependent dehydrogenase (short-subunit alcohol dehydrogenase family)